MLLESYASDSGELENMLFESYASDSDDDDFDFRELENMLLLKPDSDDDDFQFISEEEHEENYEESQTESEDEEVETPDDTEQGASTITSDSEDDGFQFISSGEETDNESQPESEDDLEESDIESQSESEDDQEELEESDNESQPESEDLEVQTTDADSDDLAVNGNNSAPTIATLTLSDLDVFDCTICTEPLTIPVYQCENGHFSCWSCRYEIKRCPSCSKPMGYKRCRGMEKVLESIKVSCQNLEHGCVEKTSYCKKLEHENSCKYTPTPCPYPSCDYIGGRYNLYMHYVKLHRGSCKVINFNEASCVRMGVEEELFLLVERKTDIPFFINRVIGPLGSFVHVSTPVNVDFSYELTATVGEKSVTVKNTVKVTEKDFEKPAMENCVLITPDFYEGLDNSLWLQLVIYW